MLNKESIGGFFSLEINNRGTLYHDDSILLNTGRNSLEYILLKKAYKRIYIPYYTCDAILEPLERIGIEYSFYSIDSNFLPKITEISKGDAILYTNYFGVMTHNVIELVQKFEDIIIDNSQAFFEMPKVTESTFYSPRKFFGVPDGGLVYCYSEDDKINYPVDDSSDRFSHLIRSIEVGKENSYLDFQNNELLLSNLAIRQMSNVTKMLLKSIDYIDVMNKRRSNFYKLHELLCHTNILTEIIDKSNFVCPMVYPYYSKNSYLLRERLIKEKIFIPKYWQNVLNWVERESLEFELVENILPLPIDQRYGELEMASIVELI